MITYEETVQTVLNLIQEKAQLQLKVQQLEARVRELENGNKT